MRAGFGASGAFEELALVVSVTRDTTIVKAIFSETNAALPACDTRSHTRITGLKGSRKRKLTKKDYPTKSKNKKRRNVTNEDIGLNRYFQAEEVVEGYEDEDLIDDLPSGAVSRAYSPSMLIGNDLTDEALEGFPSSVPGPSRTYSPSRLLADSSDDDEGPSTAYEVPETVITKDYISTKDFYPSLDSNTFRLTSEEIDQFGLKSKTDATLLAFVEDQKLSLVGTAIVTVLRGCASTLGSELYPSSRPHYIYSPKCSPLVPISASNGLTDQDSLKVSYKPKWFKTTSGLRAITFRIYYSSPPHSSGRPR
ncbi:hypothetical protein M422DRAFT_72711 [Sphaerobolus stellatus SS14]|uniref:Uncharacterized protein n=1 Tax=Sphaerobolus stellatus (strain SS14) TaxID=990650 RepID=A0A0C9T1D3_SPHS4|nr:hypothetical protein M422DRAFT_72711 [Sphaerobolus stellatus SS14]